ncbi:MAG TPA: hypothetical protein VHW94_05940 [Candidatus Dormibacteraeota bacterium]|jgi:hypothetical protein|nr:hypothetical protein [Candidatus Dormibacteraeota bacterium]
MKFFRAAVTEVIGLFVGDWAQTAVSVGILGIGWFVLSRVHVNGIAFVIGIALAAQIVYATTFEARQRARHS